MFIWFCPNCYQHRAAPRCSTCGTAGPTPEQAADAEVAPKLHLTELRMHVEAEGCDVCVWDCLDDHGQAA